MTENLGNINNNEVIREEIHEDKLRIADEVIETIVGIEASKVQHVSALSGGFTDGLVGILGKKNLGKGVRVESQGNEVKILLSIVVEYGCKIHMVAKDVQNTIRTAVENMTGLKVSEVNVNVVGINVPRETKEKENKVEEAGEDELF